MLRSTAGALMVALLLVGGCSRSSDETPAAAPVAAAPVASGAVPSAPGAVAPTDLPAPDWTVPPGQPVDSDSSPLPPPTRAPGVKAPNPADLRVGWLTATVTKGGSGPCYGVTAEDGVAWSLYSKKSVPLAKGDHVKARITPGKTPVDCGSGKPATLVRVLIGKD
ncbi:hypothetical protein KOI35_29640 [Actinoplanes bogorensis]|uniref:DUF5666 domain-containing protein n=1 Tax=Paractinoplanes bogorensis TaxID=1610840 RepID=A0ABS5YW64_9ACTN|nr:hypothetical protein [Actinoplanes bogorensis]MBU2667682.1 hypothetical protein [Actinoplanes bogorensis]